MKKLIFLPVLAFFILTLHPQELSHVTEVINIEVPVRVFDGDRFVDNLNLNDFELYENGVLQKVEAVYLIKRTAVHRREEEKRFAPKTSRSFYLFFEVYEYIPKLYDSVSYFLNNVLNPEDSLVVVTPIKTYRMRKEALAAQSKEQIAKQLNGIIRRDLLTGNSEYRNTLQDIADVARRISSGLGGISSNLVGRGTEYGELDLEQLLMMYLAFYQKLENLRSIDEKKLFDFAKYLKGIEGQKHVFLFYQREFFPQIDRKILIQAYDMFQDSPGVQQTLSELNDFRSRKIMINTDQIKKAYADSSISINFLFITTLPENMPGVTFKESSEDIFSPFLEMAKATGGFAESSANPASLMQRAAEASENYYLLYYSPKNYKSDGKFKEIKVKVKARNYRISNRAGYFAN
jgi:VWFA-related protein